MDVDRILSELSLDDGVEIFVSEAEERELLSSPTPSTEAIQVSSAPSPSCSSAPAPLIFGPNPSAPPRQPHPKPLIPPKMSGRNFKTRNFRVKNVERLAPIPEFDENPRRPVISVPPRRHPPPVTRHHSRGPWVQNPLARKPPLALMDIKFDETPTQSRRLPSLIYIRGIDFRPPQEPGRVSRQFSYGNRHDDGITRATRR